MTWLLVCDTCHQPIRGDWTTTWTATGKEIHRPLIHLLPVLMCTPHRTTTGSEKQTCRHSPGTSTTKHAPTNSPSTPTGSESKPPSTDTNATAQPSTTP